MGIGEVEFAQARQAEAQGEVQRTENAMSFVQYRRSQIAELRPYVPGESMKGISISEPDMDAGSPKPGDMIARNPKNHADQWLVAAKYFADNFEPAAAPIMFETLMAIINDCEYGPGPGLRQIIAKKARAALKTTVQS